jgi:hypothetical protein
VAIEKYQRSLLKKAACYFKQVDYMLKKHFQGKPILIFAQKAWLFCAEYGS